MGSITPLLDTLLHQVLGRQLSLDAHARQPIGPAAVSAVIRDSAVDDAAQSSDDAPASESGSSEEADFAENISTAQSRQQSAEASSTASSLRRSALPSDVATPPSNPPSAASAQLALSDTARVLSEQARLAAQQTLLSDISTDILAESSPQAPLTHVASQATPQDKPVSSTPSAQPTMLLPLTEQDPQVAFQDRAAASAASRSDVPAWAPTLSSSDSAFIDVSRAAREMSQWTAVLSGQDWQSLLATTSPDPMPLNVLSSALIMDTMGQSVPLEAQRDTLSGYLASALKTSGLFHEALLAQWAGGHLPLEIVEQSARQRQQLLSVLPAAPEFGDAVIRQQLQMMAGQSIHFQSELWAGAMMLMSFRTEPYLSDGRGGEGGAERRFPAFPDQRRVWMLTLTFELPVLGTVTAGIQWDGEALSVTLGAEHKATREVLADAREELEQLLNDGHQDGRAVEINGDSLREQGAQVAAEQEKPHA
ncbi:flagellar hook-length control protein FliK [Zymobacter sp. IVIA_12111.31 C1]|uniref:flagellar hook-length control protein FliK n=1 Tax=Zymobacter sp. IVIA_12111.31 C1 TaxID=3394854 RepID=UPI0039C3B65F